MNMMDLTSDEREQLANIKSLTDQDFDVFDIPEVAAENWKQAIRGTVRLDRDVLEWFTKHLGQEATIEINRVLRRYIAGDDKAPLPS